MIMCYASTLFIWPSFIAVPLLNALSIYIWCCGVTEDGLSFYIQRPELNLIGIDSVRGHRFYQEAPVRIIPEGSGRSHPHAVLWGKRGTQKSQLRSDKEI
jgi:hypothetical protein